MHILAKTFLCRVPARLQFFIISSISVFILLGNCSSASGAEATARGREFSQFTVELPEGWDGDEQTGFISDDPGEYLLTLGKKDDSGDHFIAQVTVFLLPNKPGANARDAANTLAESQGEATTPVQEGNFWMFKGEPRSRAMKGMGTTWVNATPENLLIIIAQDPLNSGASEIISSLKGNTPLAKSMLGR